MVIFIGFFSYKDALIREKVGITIKFFERNSYVVFVLSKYAKAQKDSKSHMFQGTKIYLR